MAEGNLGPNATRTNEDFCDHDERIYQPTLLNPEEESLRFCPQCGVVVSHERAGWRRVGGITRKVVRYAR